MITSSLAEITLRDLEKFKEEIRLFPDDRLWSVQGDIKNSAGNLALHLTGNLKHFIGAMLGNTGYVRQREKEFFDTNISKEQLLQGLNEAGAVVSQALAAFPEEKLSAIFPIEFAGRQITTFQMLLHLTTHLNYHLGQVNYLRRLHA